MSNSEQEIIKKLEPYKRTCWIPKTSNKPSSRSSSKFSGIPFIPEGTEWPKCEHCKEEMQLFVQLNSDDLPVTPEEGFGEGLLQLFYCTKIDCESKSDACIDFTGEPASKLARLINPKGLKAQEFESTPVKSAYPELKITGWDSKDDYPYDADEYKDIQLTEEKEDWVGDTADCPKAGDKLLGWPHWVQNIEYPNCPECGTEMKFIFQIDSECSLPHMFGDCGCGHITQCPNHPDTLAFAWACC